MMKLRDNKGVTLVELIVAIAIGTMVTVAANTVMLLGLRIYNNSNKEALRHQEVRMAITIMEKLVSEAADVDTDKDEQENDVVLSSGEKLLFLDGDVIKATSGVTILEGVDGFVAHINEDDLLTITFRLRGMEDEKGTYSFAVHCPVKTTIQEELIGFSLRQESPEEVLDSAIHDEALTPAVRAFLKVFASQVGSDGRIITEDGEGEYYSSWYIGGYEDHPGWSEETPWCGCFISWAMEECRGYLQGQTPLFANVDTFWYEIVTSDNWKSSDPQPGEIIFFDWILDGKMNPEHVGVVLAVRENWIFTIEGNSNNSVKICKYSTENPYILGFGQLNWN